MTTAEKKATMRRYYEEIWNNGNFTLIHVLFAPDYANYDAATPGGVVQTPDGFAQLVSGYRTTFPDLHFTIEEQVAEGDVVVTRWTVRATQQGELMGIPARGKAVTFAGVTITRFSDGTIREDDVHWDRLGLLQQLGVIPPS